MLRINQNQSSAGAKTYYTSDYYAGRQELPGQWHGRGAERLGLSGEIQKATWDALCDGIDPNTGERLMQRLKSNRTICYDFNFHVPKSVSLLYAASRDDRLLDAFREAVGETMQDIEADMQTRVRRNGGNEDRTTGNMVWGEFVHFTSRPVDGAPDPHLHLHAVVFNTTFDEQEGRWKAGQFRSLKRDGGYYEAVFHSRLAYRLSGLGLPVERTRNGWELAGVPRGLIDNFSRRTALIEETARRKGIDDPGAKAELGAKTRSRKAGDLTMPELRKEWLERMSSDERQLLARLHGMIGGGATAGDGAAAPRAVEYAISHEFERRSFVPRRQLLATALKHAVGLAAPWQVVSQFDQSGIIVGDHDGRQVATTRAVLGEEQRIVDFARRGRGACEALGGAGGDRFLAATPREKALRQVLLSRDRVTILRGVAGSGKTTLCKDIVAAVKRRGGKVMPLAPTADANRGVLRDKGFADADTVARFLLDERLQQKTKGKLIWIDEAGLVGTRTMARVFDLAQALDCRVLLTGDPRQHRSVEHGTPMQLLEDEAGLRPAMLSEIERASGKDKKEYKRIVKDLSAGRTAGGFSRLDKLGWIREVPDAERYRLLAADYAETVGKGKTALVVSPTHAEGERITAEIRTALKDIGLLGCNERSVRVLVNAQLTEAERRDPLNYRAGDVLIFHQNAKGYLRGERVAVNGRALPLEHANRFSVFHARTISLASGDMVRITHNGVTADGKHQLNNGALYRVRAFDRRGNIVLDNGWTVARDFGHLAYGFVVTSHASQGRTFDRVLVGQSSQSFAASSREQFYVSCSRGRESVTVYCDDKTALKEAVDQSEDRTTATELFNRHRHRQIFADWHRGAELAETKSRSRVELAYER